MVGLTGILQMVGLKYAPDKKRQRTGSFSYSPHPNYKVFRACVGVDTYNIWNDGKGYTTFLDETKNSTDDNFTW